MLADHPGPAGTTACGRAAALAAGHEGKRDRQGPWYYRENGERAPAPGPAQADHAARAGPSVRRRRTRRSSAMRAADRGTGGSREDMLLSRLYQQVTERQ